MTYRFNAPPNWPPTPPGWEPPPGWQPDPSWGDAPDDWEFWVEDNPETRSAHDVAHAGSALTPEPPNTPGAPAGPDFPPQAITPSAPPSSVGSAPIGTTGPVPTSTTGPNVPVTPQPVGAPPAFDQVQPTFAPTASAVSARPMGASTSGGGDGNNRKILLGVIIGAAALIVGLVVVILVLLLGGGSTSEDDPANGSLGTPKPTSSANLSGNDDLVAADTAVELGNWTIKIGPTQIDAIDKAKELDSSATDAPKGRTFIFVKIDLTNNSNNAESHYSVLPVFQNRIYDEESDPDSSCHLSAGESRGEIPANGTKTIYRCLYVPEDKVENGYWRLFDFESRKGVFVSVTK